MAEQPFYIELEVFETKLECMRAALREARENGDSVTVCTQRENPEQCEHLRDPTCKSCYRVGPTDLRSAEEILVAISKGDA